MAPQRTLEVHPGDVFGYWNVMSETRMRGRRAALVVCRCGANRTVALSDLVYGKTQSCGCYHREVHAVYAKEKFSTHSLTHNPQYNRWAGMMSRCYSENNRSYSIYGGRGITVYEGWHSGPADFIAWIDTNLGPCPPAYSLDRINNDGNYEPGNLRWADKRTQRMNQRGVN